MSAHQRTAHSNLVGSDVLPAQPKDFPAAHASVNRTGERPEKVGLCLPRDGEELPNLWTRPGVDVPRLVLKSAGDPRDDPTGAEHRISIEQPFLDMESADASQYGESGLDGAWRQT